MTFFDWVESKTQRLRWYDFSIFKICMIAFTLMVAKLWAPILSWEWYWYAVIFVVTDAWLLWRMFR